MTSSRPSVIDYSCEYVRRFIWRGLPLRPQCGRYRTDTFFRHSVAYRSDATSAQARRPRFQLTRARRTVALRAAPNARLTEIRGMPTGQEPRWWRYAP